MDHLREWLGRVELFVPISKLSLVVRPAEKVGPIFLEDSVGVLNSVRWPVINNGKRSRLWQEDAPLVFGFPRGVVTGGEVAAEIDGDWNLQRTAGADVESQPRVRLTFLGYNEHDGPIDGAEAASERLFVTQARCRGRAGMGVNPNAAEARRLQALVNL